MEPTHSSPPPPTSVSSPNSLHQHDERVRMSSPSSSNNVEQGQDLTSRNEVCNYSFSLINTMKHQSQLSIWSFFNLNEALESTQYIEVLYKIHIVTEMPILKAPIFFMIINLFAIFFKVLQIGFFGKRNLSHSRIFLLILILNQNLAALFKVFFYR